MMKLLPGQVLLGCLVVFVGLMSPVLGDFRYSPQLAVGSGNGLTAEVDLTFINLSDRVQHVDMFFRKADGTSLSLTYADTYVPTPRSAVQVSFGFGAGQAVSAKLSSEGALTVGWIEFEFEDDATGREVIVQATFKNLDSNGHVVAAVGIPIRGAGTDYVMAVEAGAVLDVGVAIANTGTVPATVMLTLLNRGGGQAGSAVELVVEGRSQVARFVRTGEDAFFAGIGPQIGSRLVISSDQPIAVLGLRADFGGPFLISGIPVTLLNSQPTASTTD